MPPVIAQNAPIIVSLEAGKTYHYCTCGKSAKQPFCDGAHKGSDFTPKPFTANKTGEAHLCGCKHSANKPYCDGRHKNL